MKTIMIALAVMLNGCGVVAKVNARQDMEASKVSYKACLLQHPQDYIGSCEAARISYEVDAGAYRSMSAGIRPGYVVDVGGDR